MPETKSLSVDLLRIDADTQSRVAINEEVVEDYSEIIEGSKEWPFDPIDVFHDGNDYLLADGFHRTLGAKRAKRSSIPCRIHKGTARDARIFGMTANDRHGLRMSRKDKRSCVEWLLDNEPKMTQEEISRKAGVSQRLVKYIVAERRTKKGQIAPSPPAKVGRSTAVSREVYGGSNDLWGNDSISEKGKPGGERQASSETTPVSSGPASEEAADSSDCQHEWVSAVNSAVKSGEMCSKCHSLRSGEGGDVIRAVSGEEADSGTETTEEPQERGHRPPRSGKDKSVDYGKCPNCAGVKWDVETEGVSCSKCHHPHGEPVGDRAADEDPAETLREKTRKTGEAFMRCFDDLQLLVPKPGAHKQCIELCKSLLKSAKGWK